MKSSVGDGTESFITDGLPIAAATEFLPEITPVTTSRTTHKHKSAPNLPPADSTLYRWLQSIKLEEIYPKLADEGYDDAEVIME
jgi:hypothetical protein